MKLFLSKILIAFYLLTTCLNAQQASDQVMPETDTVLAVNFEAISKEVAKSLEAKAKGEPVFAKNWMVSVANPHAAAAGARVLSEGGTAADAMVSSPIFQYHYFLFPDRNGAGVEMSSAAQ